MKALIGGLLLVATVAGAQDARPIGPSPETLQLREDIAVLQRYIVTLKASRDASDLATVEARTREARWELEVRALRERVRALEADPAKLKGAAPAPPATPPPAERD